jgi:hypothetical protein
MTDSRFSKICPACTAGRHRECSDPLCCCIVVHDGDAPVMRGFKIAKQRLHPERAALTEGGFEPGPRALDARADTKFRTKGTKMTDQPQSADNDDASRRAFPNPSTLALHLASEHADAGSMYRAYTEAGGNRDSHHREHTGPGGIRDHDERDLSWDREKVRAVLREADEEEEAPSAGPDEAETAQPEPEPRDRPGDGADAALRHLDAALIVGSQTGGAPLELAGPPRYSVYGRMMGEMLAGLEARASLKATPADGITMVADETAIIFGKSLAPGLAALGRSAELAMHMTGVHGDAGAIDEDPEDNMAFHREEHEHDQGHPEDDLSYDPARVVEILARQQEDGGDRSLSEDACLALHLASAHHDDQAFFRTVEQNEEAHRAVPSFMHRHTDVQSRYELALIQKIEADLGDGTTLSWCPVPHPPHEVADLARMIGDIHEQNAGMDADLIAVDLAWIKTATWPWRRRLRAAALIAFPLAWPPSWYLDRDVRKAARR